MVKLNNVPLMRTPTQRLPVTAVPPALLTVIAAVAPRLTACTVPRYNELLPLKVKSLLHVSVPVVNTLTDAPLVLSRVGLEPVGTGPDRGGRADCRIRVGIAAIVDIQRAAVDGHAAGERVESAQVQHAAAGCRDAESAGNVAVGGQGLAGGDRPRLGRANATGALIVGLAAPLFTVIPPAPMVSVPKPPWFTVTAPPPELRKANPATEKF